MAPINSQQDGADGVTSPIISALLASFRAAEIASLEQHGGQVAGFLAERPVSAAMSAISQPAAGRRQAVAALDGLFGGEEAVAAALMRGRPRRPACGRYGHFPRRADCRAGRPIRSASALRRKCRSGHASRRWSSARRKARIAPSDEDKSDNRLLTPLLGAKRDLWKDVGRHQQDLHCHRQLAPCQHNSSKRCTRKVRQERHRQAGDHEHAGG